MFYSFGRGGSTALDWYDVVDPRPDYYKNLPSDDRDFNGYTSEERDYLWQTNEAWRQLDFDYFYFYNRKNLYTVYDVGGGRAEPYREPIQLCYWRTEEMTRTNWVLRLIFKEKLN
ncbi:MAG: hypothetical protein R2764_20800 [Bacteroidales bacterium]